MEDVEYRYTDAKDAFKTAQERIDSALERKAQALKLNELGLTEVPSKIGDLKEIKELNLLWNKLSALPDSFERLLSLERLFLSNNKLQRLPSCLRSLSNLDELWIERTQLSELPGWLNDFPKLRRLRLSGNPSLEIPSEIVASEDPSKILRYYFESRAGKGGPLMELKLLLVGRGGAGKTTLVKRLAREQIDAHEQETHSISIRELTLECPSGNIRTRAWDFGGQEILHATHQFFLTERSLYLLVLEPRSGLAQRDAEYWLKLIEAQGNGSPTIVIMNKSHERPWRVDEVKLRRKFPFIVQFLPTDALQGEGIDHLRNVIHETIERRMPHVWLPFPRRWRDIKEAVAGMRKNFLTYDQFTDLCHQSGETDPGAQADLAGILHALGLALYFGKEPLLQDTRVLNPSWVTGGVYAVIRSHLVKKHDGHLTVSDMSEVLREAHEKKLIDIADYPPAHHRFILELMRSFQLCYTSERPKEEQQQKSLTMDQIDLPGVENQLVRYLVPELLPEFEPPMADSWEIAGVRLRYRYDLLPPALLPRFIVRTHALSDDSPHWRHGVVLRHSEARALIREESDRPELHVFVLGRDDETRRVLVAMVRRELETLHAELRIHPIEELELSGDSERWISVKSLRDVEQPGKTTQTLNILPEGTAEINVSQELDKLIPADARAIDRAIYRDPNSAPVPVRVFVSFAHDDEEKLKRLDLILDILEQQHGLTAWSDKRLISGDEWDPEIRRRLEEMDIFFFIASQTSLIRPYIKDPELRRARERREKGEIEIVNVKLEPCASDEDDFLKKFQRLAPKFKSIDEARLKSAVWEQVRKDLLAVIQRVRARRRKKR
jgi:internalin A